MPIGILNIHRTALIADLLIQVGFGMTVLAPNAIRGGRVVGYRHEVKGRLVNSILSETVFCILRCP